jgi:tetratricopeptide (TPR) repeat protein
MRTQSWLVATVLVVLCGGSNAAGLQPPTESETLDWLRQDRFAQLDEHYSAIQHAYKQGQISDEDLRAAFRAFYSTDPALEPKYAAWVQRFPRSYVAHLARGIYFKKVGMERRGGAFIGQTSDAQIRGMQAANAVAAREFDASLALDDRPLLTYLHDIDLHMDDGDDTGSRKLLDRAVKIDPRNFIVREKYMGSLQTRWGGSVEQMRAFLAECQQAGLDAHHLQTLAALVAEDEGWVHQQEGDKEAAVGAYREAARLNPSGACTPCGPLSQAADLSIEKRDFKGAIELYSEVLAADATSVRALDGRAIAELELGQQRAAFADLKQAVERNDTYAEVALARMYYAGQSVPPDREKAVALLKKAADAGDENAKRLLPLVMDPNQRLIVPDATGAPSG